MVYTAFGFTIKGTRHFLSRRLCQSRVLGCPSIKQLKVRLTKITATPLRNARFSTALLRGRGSARMLKSTDGDVVKTSEETRASLHWPVVLYVPNLIGYLRITLVAAAALTKQFETSIACYVACASLDFFDGIAARALKQTSRFGAVLDVAVDNVQRAVAWHHAACAWSAPAFVAVPCVEWMVFAITHATSDSEWKEDLATTAKTTPPLFVRVVMANGFKTVPGLVAISGLHCLPAALWCAKSAPAQTTLSALSNHRLVLGILILGRLLAFAVEAYVATTYLSKLADADRRKKTTSRTS